MTLFRSLPILNLAFRHMTIVRRLALAFGLVLLLFAGTTAFAVYKMKSLEADLKAAIYASTEVTSQALRMRDSINDSYMNVLLVTMVQVKDDLTFHSGEFKTSMANYRQAKAGLLKMTHDGADIPGLAEAMKLVDDGEGVIHNCSTMIEARLKATKDIKAEDAIEIDPNAQAIAIFTVREAVNFWLKSVNTIVDATAREGQRTAEKAQTSIAMARKVLMFAAGSGLLISVLAAWLIARSVTRPLRQAVNVAEKVAKGDLSQDIRSESADETGALLDALARMQHGLHDLVRDVRDSASSIEQASSEVASGNTDLSQRTEQTAGNLQRTSSSMKRLTGSVRQSAESAQAANTLVTSAAAAAERGGEVVAKVVDNMQAIAIQSKKIADIIGVIDGIAFQTNILALNAAVEAARAGEQGRGFAVVASEVRNLAQRSAAAAKDIKSLIGASVEQVESGSRLVDDAGRTMTDIVSSVRRVTAMIGEISASALVQNADIGEVGGAMNQLDQMTQQNAALVEQSAAAAESLKTQAQRLSQVVATFTLRAAADEEVASDLRAA